MEDKIKIDLRTRNILDSLKSILKAANKYNKKIVVSSGLAIEIEAGNARGDNQLTRNHDDLDIHPLEKDIPFWKKWFSSKGYTISGNDEIKDDTRAFVAHSPYSEALWSTSKKAFYVDMYGIFIDKSGIIHTRQSGEDDNWEMNWNQAFSKYEWMGFGVWVLNHDLILKNKTETAKRHKTSLRQKDLHDFKLFAK